MSKAFLEPQESHVVHIYNILHSLLFLLSLGTPATNASTHSSDISLESLLIIYPFPTHDYTYQYLQYISICLLICLPNGYMDSLMKYVGLAHYCIPGRNGLNEIVLIKEDHNFEITTTSLPNLSVLFGLEQFITLTWK